MKKYILVIMAAFSSFAAQADDVKVITTIKPLHSLVANVMGETGEPALLVNGNDSPHDFQFRPSQIEAFNKAEVIFYVDDSIESFLKRPLAALPTNVVKVRLSELKGLNLIDTDGHSHEHEHDGEEHAELKNMHFWLSPKIAVTLVNEIERVLSEKYPANAKAYKANADKTILKLNKLDQEIAAQINAKEMKPYLLYHNAFQYFEQAYGLEAKGYINSDPTMQPSLGHVKEIRGIIEKDKIGCIFTEPQFNKKSVTALVGKKIIYVGELDENGAILKAGKELYFDLLRKNAKSFVACSAG